MSERTRFECWVKIRDVYGCKADEVDIRRIVEGNLREDADVEVLEIKDVEILDDCN